MPLLDQDTSVVDGLGKSKLEDLKFSVQDRREKVQNLGLQPALEEILNLEAQHIIELHPIVAQHTGPKMYNTRSAQYFRNIFVLSHERCSYKMVYF